MLRVRAMTATAVKTRKARPPRARYSDLHPESPIAHACDVIGPVRVVDNLRADVVHAVGRNDYRRAYGLGVISTSTGLAPDSHQTESGLWSELAPADYLAQWIATACHWATSGGVSASGSDIPTDEQNDDRASAYDAEHDADVQQWASDLVALPDLPQWWSDWAGRVVHPPKFAYLVELGAWAWLGQPEPITPPAEWGVKVRRQWANRSRTERGRTTERA